jgi:hypothetical protein
MSDDTQDDQDDATDMTNLLDAPPMHDQVRDQIVDLVLASVEPAGRVAFDAHLASCAACSAFLDETEQMSGLLAVLGQVHQPPPELREAILREAREDSTGRSRREDATPADVALADSSDELAAARGRRRVGAGWSPSTLLSRVVAVAAAVLLAASVGWGITEHQQRNSASAEASAYSQAIDTLTSPGTMSVAELDGSSGSPVATAFVRSGSAVVMPQDLKANDRSTSIYVLWSLTSPTDSAPVAIGSFDVTGGAKMSAVSATGAAASGTWYAVSIENGRRVPAAPTTVLGAGNSA